MKTCNTLQGSDLKQIQGEFEQTNKNIEEILQKLDKLPVESFEKGTEMDGKDSVTHSIRECFTNSLKKIAVATLSAFYAVADITIEKTSDIKEGFQDITAEAQYENKRRKCQPVENRKAFFIVYISLAALTMITSTSLFIFLEYSSNFNQFISGIKISRSIRLISFFSKISKAVSKQVAIATNSKLSIWLKYCLLNFATIGSSSTNLGVGVKCKLNKYEINSQNNLNSR